MNTLGYIDFQINLHMIAYLAFPGLPFLPKVIRLFGFAITKEVIHLDVERVSPPYVVCKPPDSMVRLSIGFVIAVRGNAIGAPATSLGMCPVHAAVLGIYRPRQYASGVRHVAWFGGSSIMQNSL